MCLTGDFLGSASFSLEERLRCLYVSSILIIHNIEDHKTFHVVTNHPVHLVDKEENISPSAFIPFCAFGDDMKSMGTEFSGFHDPVCNSFEAKIRNDQLCYEVDLEKYKDQQKIKDQLKSGLALVLDYNLDRQSEMYNPRKVHENDAHIHIDTISKFYALVFF